jgi:hypothetical protein
MSFRNRVHVLSDQLEGDAPIVWRRDWPSLLALALITLLTGPWLVLALWVQRWNVRTLWDAKDHWEGTKQFAVTFVIIGILSVIAFIQFQPALSVLGSRNIWSWLFYHTLFWWFWWALLTPTFALVAERIDPRTQRIRRVLLPQERPPAPQSAASDEVVAQSRKKKATTPKKKRKGRPVPLGILLAEEKAEMERRRTQINYIQPSLPSHEGIEVSPAVPVSSVPEESLPLPAETASGSGSPKSKKQPERRKPESLDNLF